MWEEGREDNIQFFPYVITWPNIVIPWCANEIGFEMLFADIKSLEVAINSHYHEYKVHNILVNSEVFSNNKLVIHNMGHNYMPQITVKSVIILIICKKKKKKSRRNLAAATPVLTILAVVCRLRKCVKIVKEILDLCLTVFIFRFDTLSRCKH